jgi:hypothetical protein
MLVPVLPFIKRFNLTGTDSPRLPAFTSDMPMAETSSHLDVSKMYVDLDVDPYGCFDKP